MTMAPKRKAEPAWSAREENRKSPERRFLPYEDFYLFHSELAGGARHQEKRNQLDILTRQ